MAAFFKFLGILIAGAIVLGPIVGPVAMATSTSATHTVPDQFLGAIELDCGSVFSPEVPPVVTDAFSWEGGSVDDTPSLRAELKSDCDDALSKRKGVGIGITVVGAAIWLAVGIAWIRSKKNPVQLFSEWQEHQRASSTT